MNSIDFCFWLQGYFEISDTTSVTPKQLEIIKNHLDLVFKHEIDPLRESDPVKSEILNEIHTGTADTTTWTPSAVTHGRDPLVRC